MKKSAKLTRFWALLLATIAYATLSSPASAVQVNPANWNFSLETTGSDAFWTSPTNVDPGLVQYDIVYEVTTLDLDLTDAANVSSTLSFVTSVTPNPGNLTIGALPVTLIDEIFELDPGNPAAPSARVQLGIDASGFGFASFTDVTLDPFLGITFHRILVEGTLGVIGVPEPITSTLGLLAASGFWLVAPRRKARVRRIDR